jgi:transaldolase
MSLQKPLTVEEALAMACEMRHAITKYGRNATTNHSQSDIREALAALALLAERQKEGDGYVSQEEHTKLKRQYAALNARYQKLAGKVEKAENEPIEQGYREHTDG